MGTEKPSYCPSHDAVRRALNQACDAIVDEITTSRNVGWGSLKADKSPPLVEELMRGPLLRKPPEKAWHSKTEFIEEALDELIHELAARGANRAMYEGLSE